MAQREREREREKDIYIERDRVKGNCAHPEDDVYDDDNRLKSVDIKNKIEIVIHLLSNLLNSLICLSFDEQTFEKKYPI